jgi:hypothetical protein
METMKDTWPNPIELAICLALIIFSVFSAFCEPARPLTIYIVSSTREAAAESILNCGNVAIESKRQAESYAAARPGSHVFQVEIRELH